MATETHHVAHVLRTETRWDAFLHASAQADLFFLAFPLYVDSLPYLVTEALERIAAHHQAQPQQTATAFVAIANCGFPEAQHCVTALAICAQFADTIGMRWLGGLALGEGGVINGQPLKAGGIQARVAAALEQAADALAAGEPLPAQAITDMASPMIPAQAYMLMGNLGWLLEAGTHHVLTHLADRPFQTAG